MKLKKLQLEETIFATFLAIFWPTVKRVISWDHLPAGPLKLYHYSLCCANLVGGLIKIWKPVPSLQPIMQNIQHQSFVEMNKNISAKLKSLCSMCLQRKAHKNKILLQANSNNITTIISPKVLLLLAIDCCVAENYALSWKQPQITQN